MRELSEYLKSERLKLGLTLQAVSERAHLSVGILQCIEDGNFERIGTPLLIRSFIRSYCSVLEIDVAPLLEKYESEILAFDRQDDGIQQYGIWTRSLRRKRRRGILLLLLLAMIMAAAYYGGNWLSKRKARQFDSQSKTISVYPQQELPSDLQEETATLSKADVKKERLSIPELGAATTPEAADGKTEHSEAHSVFGMPQDSHPVRSLAEGINPSEILPEDKPPAVSPEVQKHRLEIEATGKTWVKLKIDGKTARSIDLRAGDKREWEADQGIGVTVGDGAAARIMWDGRPLETAGKRGRVLRLQLPLADQPKKLKTP